MDFTQLRTARSGEVAGLHCGRPFAEVVERSLPSPMMARRSAKASARGRSWVTMTMVMPSCDWSSRRRVRMASPVAESRLPVGSSARRILGRLTRAAGDGDALLFAAGKFRGAMAEAMREANAFEGFANAGGALGAVDFSEAKREFDVFLEGHAREKVEGLKDHADGVAAVAGETEGGKRGDVPAVGEDGAGGGAVRGRR